MQSAGLHYIKGRIPRDLSEDFESRNIAIDMHYLPVPEKHIHLFDMESFWSNTMCVEMDGLKIHIPSPQCALKWMDLKYIFPARLIKSTISSFTM